jgi:hypothetical protein
LELLSRLRTYNTSLKLANCKKPFIVTDFQWLHRAHESVTCTAATMPGQARPLSEKQYILIVCIDPGGPASPKPRPARACIYSYDNSLR